MPRVLHLVSRFNVGGPARHLLALVPAMQAIGWDCSIASGPAEPDEGDLLAEAAEADIEVRLLARLRRSPGFADVRVIAEVAELIEQLKPDVVHTHTAKGGAVGRLAGLKFRQDRPRMVHTFHGHVFEGYGSPLFSYGTRTFERLASRLCDRIVAVSPSVQRSLIEHRIAPPGRIEVVRVAVDSSRLQLPSRTDARAAFGLPMHVPVLACVARLAPIKRIDRLLEAAATTRSEDFHMMIVGSGPQGAELRRHPAARHLDRRLHWLGQVEDIAPVYAACDGVVLTSDNEGTPVSLIEAGICGLPVIATRVGVVEDVVTDGRTGILVSANASAVANGIERLLASAPEVRSEMGAAAVATLLERHSPRAVAAAHASLYSALESIHVRTCS